MYNNYNIEQQDNGSNREHYDSRIDKMGKYLKAMIAMCCVLALLVCVAGGALVATYVNRTDDSESNSSVKMDSNSDVQDSGLIVSDKKTDSSKPSTSGIKLYTAGDGSGEEMTTSEVVASLSDAVVAIYTEYEQQAYGYYGVQTYTTQGAGSGVIISADGHIVTNNHVVEGATSFKVVLNDGREFDAKLLGTDSSTEIALLKIDADSLTYAPLGDSDNVSVGDKAIVIGNPLGKLQGTVTQGIVSALDREITFSDGTTLNLMQTDAAVNSGNSGGAMLSDRGELIGVIVAKTSATGVEGLGYAIPVNDIKPIVEDLLEYGYVTGRPAFGINVTVITNPLTAMSYKLPSTGVYVSGFIDPEFQDKSGLEIGDCIKEVNGVEVSSTQEIKSALSDFSAGDTVEVKVIRDNQEITVNALLTEEYRDLDNM